MKSIEVVAAIITYQDKILCMQRGKGPFEYVSYKYEFPGGKLEAGEAPEAALIREIDEEMDFQIQEERIAHFLTIEHQYPDFFIKMHSFLCPAESDQFNLKEHTDFRWLPKHRLMELDWAPADIPIVKKLMAEA